MQKALFYIGWALAALGATGSAVLYRQLNTLKSQHLALSNELTTLTQTHEANEALAEKQLAALTEEEEEAPTPKETVAALPDSFNLDKVVGDIIQDMSVEADADNPEVKRGKREQDTDSDKPEVGNGRREEMKQRYMDFHYKGLVESLNLSPERAAEMQALLQSNADKVFDVQRMEREGRITEEEAQAKLAALDGEMKTQIGAMLTPQEMAHFQDFEATAPERMMAHSLNRQIKDYSNMAPGLRDKFVATFQDQLINEPAIPDGSTPLDPFTRSNVAYAHALDQLSGELAPEEYAQAQEFMDVRLRMQSAMAERMSNWGFDRSNGSRTGGRRNN